VNSTFETELRFFERHKEEWLASHLGHFVVISGPTMAGFHSSYEAALKAGLQSFGLRTFLIKQVLAEEPVYFIY
jgi:hypothetical protein